MSKVQTDKRGVYPGVQDVKDDKESSKSDNSDDSGIVDWNDSKSIVEKNRHMLESQMSCDVMFTVGEKEEKLGAHKFVLMQRSDVFFHLFSGPEGAKSEFVVPEISGDCFWEVLRHIYCNDQKLQVTTVVGILYAANKYNLIELKASCLRYLHANLELNNACFLLMEVHKYEYLEDEKKILSYIRKNASDVFKTKGMDLLSRELLNQVLTMQGLDVEESLKEEVADRWARNHCDEKQQEANMENMMDSLHDCLYVYRDDSSSHRFVLDSVTTKTLFGDPVSDEQVPTDAAPQSPEINGPDEVDGMSTITSSSARSSVHTLSRLPSCHMWSDLEKVTRLQEIHGSDENTAQMADAIGFTADCNLYMYGFGIYGPKHGGEGKFQVDTILTRKKRDIVLESIHIKGAGVILPVMFERPVKIDKGKPYTLEIYIRGPVSHLGASGQTKVQQGPVLFTFNQVKVKKNRSDISKGQIPRLYYLMRGTKK